MLVALTDNLRIADLIVSLLVSCSHCFQYINSTVNPLSTLCVLFYGYVCPYRILIANYALLMKYTKQDGKIWQTFLP